MHSSRMRTGRSLTVCCSLLPGGGGLPGPGGGVCLCRGGSPCRGVSAWSGGSPCPGGVSGQAPSPPVNRITDTCKNITLATTSLRPVISDSLDKYFSSGNRRLNRTVFRCLCKNPGGKFFGEVLGDCISRGVSIMSPMTHTQPPEIASKMLNEIITMRQNDFIHLSYTRFTQFHFSRGWNKNI